MCPAEWLQNHLFLILRTIQLRLKSNSDFGWDRYKSALQVLEDRMEILQSNVNQYRERLQRLRKRKPQKRSGARDNYEPKSDSGNNSEHAKNCLPRRCGGVNGKNGRVVGW